VVRWPFATAGKAVPAPLVGAAWREYRATRAEAARDILIQRYVHLVRYMARRLARTFPPSVETEDLVSAGVQGFLRALDGYDPELGTDFAVYALTRIRGAMVDFVRESDPIGRVTRRRLRDAARALADLEQQLGRSPSQADAAARLGLSMDAYHGLMSHASAAAAMSLERLRHDDEDDGQAVTRSRIPDPAVKSPLACLAEKERSAEVAAMVGQLAAGHQLVLHLHYVEELNFREIAMILDVSESRATQLHAAALAALRGRAGVAAPALLQPERL
jgi:RNA polymerase sigma factor for flagellar operon FliA